MAVPVTSHLVSLLCHPQSVSTPPSSLCKIQTFQSFPLHCLFTPFSFTYMSIGVDSAHHSHPLGTLSTISSNLLQNSSLFSFRWLFNATRVLWWHRPLVNLAQDALVRHWTTIIYSQKCLSAPWHSFSVSEVLLEITSKFEMFHHIITVITWKNFILISSYTSF